MMQMKLITSFLVFFASSGLLIAGGEATGADPVAGKSAAIICIGCHAVDGNSTTPDNPKLAGQGAGYLAKQLTDFKSGKRKEQHMSSMVEAITTEDIPNIAAYFSQQKRRPTATKMAGTSLGKDIFANGIEDRGISACNECHGEKAEGNPAIRFPALAGQHADYLTKMLKEFRSGQRHNDPGEMMRNIAETLTDIEIDSLSRYLSGLK